MISSILAEHGSSGDQASIHRSVKPWIEKGQNMDPKNGGSGISFHANTFSSDF